MKRKYVRTKFLKYTVYDNRTDDPACICETAKKCAEMMGVKVSTFYNLVRGRKANGSRWTILKCGNE